MNSVVTLLSRVRGTEPINEMAVALILTEARFRPLHARIVEVALAFFSLKVLRKEPTLTLGKCQVNFRYWRRRFGVGDMKLLLSTFDDRASYQVCCDYLKPVERQSLRDILVYFNGCPSALYVQVFRRNLCMVRQIRATLGRYESRLLR
jgi:hypothetical protein